MGKRYRLFLWCERAAIEKFIKGVGWESTVVCDIDLNESTEITLQEDVAFLQQIVDMLNERIK